MAITQINDYAIGDSNLNAIMTSLDKTYKGKSEMSLSEYDTTAAPVIKVGSVFENNGALYVIDTSDITPTGYAGITVSTTFYIVYDDSASAFIYSEVAPTWSDAFQGWYSGNDRYFFSMYKDSGGTLYENKNLLMAQNNFEFPNALTALSINTDNAALKFKVVSGTISATSNNVSIAHGLTVANIRGLAVAANNAAAIEYVNEIALNGANVIVRLLTVTAQDMACYVTISYV